MKHKRLSHVDKVAHYSSIVFFLQLGNLESFFFLQFNWDINLGFLWQKIEANF